MKQRALSILLLVTLVLTQGTGLAAYCLCPKSVATKAADSPTLPETAAKRALSLCCTRGGMGDHATPEGTAVLKAKEQCGCCYDHLPDWPKRQLLTTLAERPHNVHTALPRQVERSRPQDIPNHHRQPRAHAPPEPNGPRLHLALTILLI